MLTQIELENFRSFTNSGTIELADINVFVGPNNAGKTTILSLIELALISNQHRGPNDPLALDEQPAFASFDSIASQNIVPGKSRPKTFSVSFGWGSDPAQPDSGRKQALTHTAKFHFKKKSSDGSAYVGSATYTIQGEKELRVEFNSKKQKLCFGFLDILNG